MKRALYKGWVLLVLILFANVLFAEVRLPAILGSHMVLQQTSSIKLWGWADSGEGIKIKCGWDSVVYSTQTLSTGKWEVNINTPIAGGPFIITINASNTIVLEDVMIGEVWDCSGQSNMEMSYSWGVSQYAQDVTNATNKNIRLFKVPRSTAEFPLDDTRGKWVVCNPEDLKKFSLVGYFFGKKLQETLDVAIGLIDASWGGTPAEVWTPKDSIEHDPLLKEAAARLEYNSGWPITPGSTFNAMINPNTNFSIAGVIWYQGEANVNTAHSYQRLLSTMINSWRKAWRKDLPFYYVQIAPFAGYKGDSAASLLREAQARILSVPNTGMVVVHDLVDNINDIHPKNKKDVGLRLASYALGATYGQQGITYKSPMYDRMVIKKNKIILQFINADNGLISKGGTPTDFYIAGKDRIFKPAGALIKGNTVVVSSKEVKHPVAVRFGFSNRAMPNLFSKEGLPVSIFRTDDW